MSHKSLSHVLSAIFSSFFSFPFTQLDHGSEEILFPWRAPSPHWVLQCSGAAHPCSGTFDECKEHSRIPSLKSLSSPHIAPRQFLS